MVLGNLDIPLYKTDKIKPKHKILTVGSGETCTGKDALSKTPKHRHHMKSCTTRLLHSKARDNSAEREKIATNYSFEKVLVTGTDTEQLKWLQTQGGKTLFSI